VVLELGTVQTPQVAAVEVLERSVQMLVLLMVALVVLEFLLQLPVRRLLTLAVVVVQGTQPVVLVEQEAVAQVVPSLTVFQVRRILAVVVVVLRTTLPATEAAESWSFAPSRQAQRLV